MLQLCMEEIDGNVFECFEIAFGTRPQAWGEVVELWLRRIINAECNLLGENYALAFHVFDAREKPARPTLKRAKIFLTNGGRFDLEALAVQRGSDVGSALRAVMEWITDALGRDGDSYV